ncbi:MAG: pyridoxal 5'-phosphate synthase glutaminase subunit PdxT [Mycobacteriales bacterium]|nr:pyridoxal 5'-phosphate synthase glutaminase subunit PdxT [Frankia sp.]
MTAALPRAPRVGVLALQGDVREHARMLAAVGAEPVEVRRAAELASVDALIVPGGESTTIGNLCVTFELLEPLQKAVADGLPMFGSCAGMILLADEVLDGKPDQPLIGGLDITVRRNAFGRQVDSFEADLDIAGVVGGAVHAVFIRAPWVERVANDVEVLAAVAGHPVAVRQGQLFATSFHPELTDDTRLHALFVQSVVGTD